MVQGRLHVHKKVLNCRGAQLKPGDLARRGGGGSRAEGARGQAGRQAAGRRLHQSLTEGADSINQVVE